MGVFSTITMSNTKSSLLWKSEILSLTYEKNVRSYKEPIAQQCVVCRGSKTSKIEMKCTFCDSYGYITEGGTFVLEQYKETLLEDGIINKNDEKI